MSTPLPDAPAQRPRTVLVTGAAKRLGRSIALALAADGMLYPCEHFVGVDELAMGHVDDYPDARSRRIVARFAAATTAGRPRCQACAVRGACGGQCYAEAYLANGNIELPAADYCGRIHATFRALAPDLAQGMADVEQAGRLRQAIGVE